MDIKELMVGDFVRTTKTALFPKGTIVEVKAVDAERPSYFYVDTEKMYKNKIIGVVKCSNEDGETNGVWAEYLEPIPITKEILEKNGFEKVLDDDNTECYRYFNSAADGYVKITLWDCGAGDWSVEIVNYNKFDDNGIAQFPKIVYKNNFTFLKLHQFQQVLRFCEIEKEIIV